MNNAQFARLFPLGSHLCREPMPPMSELKRDMAILKQRGFNLIKLQEHWAVDEPLEGQYDFSRYQELIAEAARLDMGVYLGLTCEQAPGWLWAKHPGCRMVGRDGLPIAYEAPTTLPADGKPGPCFDHPGARADMIRFIKALVGVLGQYENVVVWNTWQEIAYWAEGLVGQPVCYCPHTLAAWRQWLQGKYGDLDGLNGAWNHRYGDWAHVQPNRAARGPNALPQDMDWGEFMDTVQVARVLRVRAQAIKEADPLKRPVFAHKGGPIIGSGQDWVYARCQDFLGSSAYPAWGPFRAWDDGRPEPAKPVGRGDALLAEMWDGLALRYDYIRSCNPRGNPVWAAEFQGGPVSTGFHKGRVPEAGDMRRWMLTAVGSGVTAISFWVTRAEIMAAEANGFSLLDSLGDTTPRLEEASRIGAALNRHPDLFGQPTWPGAPVAILVNERNYQFCQSMVQGGEHLGYSTRGWYRLLWDLGIPVDFLEASELDSPYVDDHKAIVMPFPLSLSEEVVARLTAFVERGGHLISEACPGRMDEQAFCHRGEISPGAAALFGVRQQGLTMVREPDGGQRWSPVERTWGEYLEPAALSGCGPMEGLSARANVYIETLDPVDSQPCLLYGDQVAGAVRAVGQGQAWLLGTYLGHNGTAYRDADTRAVVRALLARCGVEPLHRGKLLLRKRITPAKEAWLFTNPTEASITEDIPVGGYARVEDLLGQPVVVQEGHLPLTVQGLDVRCLVLWK